MACVEDKMTGVATVSTCDGSAGMGPAMAGVTSGGCTFPHLLTEQGDAGGRMPKREQALDTPYIRLDDGPYVNLDANSVRDMLVKSDQKAVVQLCSAALQHASHTITHMDEKIVHVFTLVSSSTQEDYDKLKVQLGNLFTDVKGWLLLNPIKAVFMVVGLGGTVFKAKTIGAFMQDEAQSFIDWGQSVTAPIRFLGFVGLMTLRLVISTLVPPTSPAFGIILQAATPASQKWTAMPFFLAASTLAGAVPWLLDKMLQVFVKRDFVFTLAAKQCTDNWPLTCWTAPTMNKVFQSCGGGKTGASLAVIVAHAAPFMGAQTTIMQRFFLPHPLDSIISQPFGMSEDLISMAVAEATSNPTLGSGSLTVLMVLFNLAQFFIFSRRTDVKAVICAMLNVFVGLMFVYSLSTSLGSNVLVLVGLQLIVQGVAVPLFGRILTCGAHSEVETDDHAATVLA